MYRPVPAIQPCTLVFNNWLQSVPAIQPCTLASTTGYRGINGGNWIQHKIVVNFIQQLVTGCTYWLHSLVHLLQQLVTECTDWLPAKQPCTVTSMTGYSMYRPATGFTALYSSLNWLQCTGYTALYTGFNNWLQSVPAGTGYTALYTSATSYRVYRLVLATQPCTLASFYGLQVY